MENWTGWDSADSAEKNLCKNIKVAEKWKSVGRRVVDIGPNFTTITNRVEPCKFYNAERRMIGNWKQLFLAFLERIAAILRELFLLNNIFLPYLETAF